MSCIDIDLERIGVGKTSDAYRSCSSRIKIGGLNIVGGSIKRQEVAYNIGVGSSISIDEITFESYRSGACPFVNQGTCNNISTRVEDQISSSPDTNGIVRVRKQNIARQGLQRHTDIISESQLVICKIIDGDLNVSLKNHISLSSREAFEKIFRDRTTLTTLACRVDRSGPIELSSTGSNNSEKVRVDKPSTSFPKVSPNIHVFVEYHAVKTRGINKSAVATLIAASSSKLSSSLEFQSAVREGYNIPTVRILTLTGSVYSRTFSNDRQTTRIQDNLSTFLPSGSFSFNGS